MTYQALARKWRPRSFEEVVGQSTILRILTHALENNRLHHAYLFTGTRGVGKTTLARILAKCLNCVDHVTPSPCGTCANCQAIDAGNFLDLYEIDAASRTKVEDTRDLLENVHYPPVMGRYKIYLIDEVHMLSQHSFNALLKTLEEPPAHVKFLLATTDPKRLPATILSRCLQFHLKHMGIDTIFARLKHIATAEAIAHDDGALQLLAKAAGGSMRDALSLLDQAIAFGQSNLTTSDVKNMLGSVTTQDVMPLLNALTENDSRTLFQCLNELLDNIGDANAILEEIIHCLHTIAFLQVTSINYPATHEEQLLATKLSPEIIQLYYQIALLGRRDLSLSPTPQQGIEMVFLRMLCFTLQEATEKPPIEPTIATPKPAPKKDSQPTHTMPVTPPPIQAPTANETLLPWRQLLEKLDLSGMAQLIASNCTLKSKVGDHLTLILAKQHATMLTEKLKERVQSALSHYFKTPIRLTIEIGDNQDKTPAEELSHEKNTKEAMAIQKIKKNPLIKHFLEQYDTTLDITVL
jgi:DNA polymerase-3 subunit gamma/tau